MILWGQHSQYALPCLTNGENYIDYRPAAEFKQSFLRCLDLLLARCACQIHPVAGSRLMPLGFAPKGCWHLGNRQKQVSHALC